MRFYLFGVGQREPNTATLPNKANRLHHTWLADIAAFSKALKEEGASVQMLEYLEIALTQMSERTAELAKHCSAENTARDT